MDVNLKTESLGEIPSVVDVSSDDDIAVRPSTPETNCSICLEELNNKCYSDSCWHLFCFECLKRWSTIQPSCPLCKKEFKCIYHAFNDQGLHETFDVPRRISEISSTSLFYSNADSNSIFRMNLFLDIVRRNERLMNNISTMNNQDHNHNLNMHTSAQSINFQPRVNDINMYGGRRQPPYGQSMRIRVYHESLWADPLPDLSGRYRDCSYTYYRDNPAQTFRLHPFILRDIGAIRSVELREGLAVRPQLFITDANLTTMIMQTVSRYNIRDLFIVNLLRPYIGNYTTHFIHELYNYARSPYDLIGYDRNVQYSMRPYITPSFYHAFNISDVYDEIPRPITPLRISPSPRLFSETIVLDTDDEEIGTNSRLFGQEIIIVSSTNEEDSDVEILSHSYLPRRTLDSSRDQPSTSTGIRHSLDRPNNRYNLRRRRLFSPILNESIAGCPVHLSQITAYQTGLRRGRINLDSSSSDDDSFTPTSGPQTMHMKNTIVLDKKKRKVKKRKLRKRKRPVENSLPDLHLGRRSHSNSGSSSSFSDTDTRPNNNCLPSHTNILL